jgi:hypothetical protein
MGHSSPLSPPRTVPCSPSRLFVAVDAARCLKAIRIALAQLSDIGHHHLLKRPVKNTADERQVPQHVSQFQKQCLLIEQMPQSRTTS